MPVVKVKNLKNEEVGELTLSDAVFSAPLNKSLIYEAVKSYLANQRAGTSATKTRGDTSGSGKKLWKQKGTGRARVGSVRSPIWRHGGTVHGPRPRDYSYKLPRKMLLGALRSALSAKVRDGELKVVQKFALEERKTKNAAAALKRLDIDKKVLVIDNDADLNFTTSVRNLKDVTLLASRDVTPYHLLGHERVLVSESAARKLSEALAS
jgi:large subunit ribosomal protein L4